MTPPMSGSHMAPARRLWAAVLCGYLALGATIQTLPALVAQRFSGGPLQSGTAVGIAFLATACGRPLAGLLADAGRARAVVIAGGVLVGLGGLGHLWAPAFPVLLLARVVMGLGEAALFSGALPWVLAGVAAQRRGRVAGWFGLSMWTGLAAGPVLATGLTRWLAADACWLAVAALGGLAAGLVLTTRPSAAPVVAPRFPRSLRAVLPAGAALPGLVLGLASYGYGSVAALLILHLRHARLSGADIGLAVFAVCFLATRALGSPLVDRCGGARVAVGSLAVEATGLLVVGFARQEPAALFGVALAGAGVALIYPSAVALTMSRSDAGRPGASVGATTSFWDLGMLAAGLLGGLLADRLGYPAAFGAAALAALAAALLVQGRLRPIRVRVTQLADQRPVA